MGAIYNSFIILTENTIEYRRKIWYNWQKMIVCGVLSPAAQRQNTLLQSRTEAEHTDGADRRAGRGTLP